MKIIQFYKEPKLKSENDFSDQRLRINAKHFDCQAFAQAFDFESALESVCINNYIKEVFIVFLTADLRLSSI